MYRHIRYVKTVLNYVFMYVYTYECMGVYIYFSKYECLCHVH